MRLREVRAFVFDAYGTLFDVHSVTARADDLFPGRGAELSQRWRTRQLEYTWLTTLMSVQDDAPRADFEDVTTRALDWAAASLGLALAPSQRDAMLAAYRMLSPFDDAPPALAALAPRPRWILSNGTLPMLEPLAAQPAMQGRLDGVLSAQAAGVFKPHPAVYRLAVDRLGLAPADIGFVSSNGWDAIGAKRFGFNVFWINRAGAPLDRHGPAPDVVLRSLAELPALAGAASASR